MFRVRLDLAERDRHTRIVRTGHQVVREQDDLPVLCHFDQAMREATPPLMIQRIHRVVEYDGGTALLRCKFRKETGERDALVLAF